MVSCNLQRLDGPVRGNGKIIQELESVFRGAGWNVIKVIWAREWDPLLARDVDGVLVDKMNSTNDGQFQKYSTESGAYIREHFFGPDPRLRRLVEHLSDDDLRHLRRGGHDYRKLYSAYRLALEQKGAPTVILAHTVKGWTLGSLFEGRNATHQIKKIGDDRAARRSATSCELPISDKQLERGHRRRTTTPAASSDEIDYLMSRRLALGGPLPKRVVREQPLASPRRTRCGRSRSRAAAGAPASTTAAFGAMLRNLLRDPEVGSRVVPIIPDEARTFGMDALFREVKIYAPFGQRYEPVDANMVLSYQEARDGQLLEEGITEAGAMGTFTAAGTAYATHGEPMIPFYIFYSMFGFQRVGDLVWAFGDARGRGFMLGGTAGRTTLNGEGLQHQDGHSPLLFSAVPNCEVYDPAYAYEVAVIIREGMRRMYERDEDVFYYLTLYNENYPMPADARRRRGGHPARPLPAAAGAPRSAPTPCPALRQRHRDAAGARGAAAAARARRRRRRLERHQLPRAAQRRARGGALEPPAPRPGRRDRRTSPTSCATPPGPVVAVTDYQKTVAEQVARFVPQRFIPLGTDGYGRSDTRAALRRHFEVDAPNIAVAALDALAADGALPRHVVTAALEQYGGSTEVAEPRLA